MSQTEIKMNLKNEKVENDDEDSSDDNASSPITPTTPQERAEQTQKQLAVLAVQENQINENMSKMSKTALKSEDEVERGVFIDSNGVSHNASYGQHATWFRKQSAWVKSWNRRFIILKGNKLFCSKDRTSAPHGMLLLDGATIKSKYVQPYYGFEITPVKGESWWLRAPDDRDTITELCWQPMVEHAIKNPVSLRLMTMIVN